MRKTFITSYKSAPVYTRARWFMRSLQSGRVVMGMRVFAAGRTVTHAEPREGKGS